MPVHVEPAPDLRADLSVAPANLKRGQDVLYRLTLDNFGTGPASGVGVLVTLPPGIDFVKTEQVSGNSSRDQPVDPVPGALVVFYSGFSVPAQGPAGPGALIIVIRARCIFCTGGTFTASAQITDAEGSVVAVRNSAQVVVTAPSGAPTPTPPPAPPPSAPAGTPAPGPTPAPTPKH